MDLYNLYAKVILDTKDYTSNLQDATAQGKQAADTLGAGAIAIGTLMANVIQKGANALVNVGKSGVMYNAQIEKYTVAITTALGGTAEAAQQAAEAIENIKRDAATTPFSVDGLVSANQYLMAAGESAEDARKNIMALSEAVSASGGSNVELQRMAQNLQQIKNTGKATAQDIKQFANAGINIYGLLADYTGMTVEETQELTVTYDLLTNALQAAAAEGGRFYGANIAQSQTLNGQISTLQDNIQSKLGEAFEGLTDTIRTGVLPAANEFVQGLDVTAVVDGMEKVAVGVGTVYAALQAQKAYSVILKNFVVPIQTAQVQLALYRMEVGATAAHETLLSGSMGVTGTVAAVLSGQLTLAEGAQVALNAAVSAFPAVFIVSAFVAAGKAAKNSIGAFNDMVGGMTDVGGTSAEVKERIAELEAQLAEMGADDAMFFVTATDEQARAAIATKQAISELTAVLPSVEEAERNAAGAAGDFAGATDGAGESARTTKPSLEELAETYEETYSKISNSVQGYFDTFSEAVPAQKADIDQMIANLQSQEDYNKQYADSIATITSANIEGLDGLAETFGDAGAEGAQYAIAIAEAIKAGDDEKVQELVQAWDATKASQEKLTAALSQTQKAFSDLKEATDNDIQSIRSALDSLDGKTVKIYYQGIQTGDHMGSVSGTRSTKHATGLDYVPFDNYAATLHKGERVLTAQENRAYGNGAGAVQQATVKEVTIPITLDIDGTILAKKLYKHNMNEQDYHGEALINSGMSYRMLTSRR